MTVAQVLAFIAIWIAVPLVFTVVASLLTKAMEAVSLGWLNRSHRSHFHNSPSWW